MTTIIIIVTTHDTVLKNGYNREKISDGSRKAVTHRHVLNLRVLAQDLNVPQLGKVEISLLLQAIHKELQLSYLQTIHTSS
jgi:hypothetical protein